MNPFIPIPTHNVKKSLSKEAANSVRKSFEDELTKLGFKEIKDNTWQHPKFSVLFVYLKRVTFEVRLWTNEPYYIHKELEYKSGITIKNLFED